MKRSKNVKYRVSKVKVLFWVLLICQNNTGPDRNDFKVTLCHRHWPWSSLHGSCQPFLSGALTPAAFIMGCESEATLEPCESTLGHSLLLYTSQVLETSSSHWGLGTPLPRLMLTFSMLSALWLDAPILSCTVLPLGQGASQPRGQDLILFVFWGITLFSPFLLHEILLHVIFFFCELNVGKWRKTACPLIYHFKKKKKMATVRTQIKPVTFSDLLRSFRNSLLKQEWSVPFSLAVFHNDKT